MCFKCTALLREPATVRAFADVFREDRAEAQMVALENKISTCLKRAAFRERKIVDAAFVTPPAPT